MPNATPSGPLSVAVSALAQLIANVPYVQALLGTDNEEDSLANIFTGDVGQIISSIQASGQNLIITTKDIHGIASVQVTIEGISTGLQSAYPISGEYKVSATSPTTLTLALPDNGVFPDIPLTHVRGVYIFPCWRPMFIVGWQDSQLMQRNIGTGGANIKSGRIDIVIECDVNGEYGNDAVNSRIEADSIAGSIVDGIISTSGTGDLMVINDANLIKGPEFTSSPEQDDGTVRFERWRAMVQVSWGLEN